MMNIGNVRIGTLVLLVPIVLSSCRSHPKNVYVHEKLTFKISEDFRIVKNNFHKPNKSTYIRLNLKGSEMDEYISITWLPGQFDLDKEIKNFADSRAENYVDDPEGSPVFSEVIDASFASNHARRIFYAVAHEGPRLGVYTTFHCNGLTVIIGQHYTPESEAQTKYCMKLIEESFDCRK